MEFLQAFIDKKIYVSLFSFFGYNNSILAGSDRFLPKNIFISTLNEILIDENLEWYCPNCGNRDHAKLNVARRTCGYIGTNFWNKGRTQEIKERVLHLDNKDA